MIRGAWNGPSAISFVTLSYDWGTLVVGQLNVVLPYVATVGLSVFPTQLGVPPADILFECDWAPGLGGLRVKAFNLAIAPIVVGVIDYQLMLINSALSSPL